MQRFLTVRTSMMAAVAVCCLSSQLLAQTRFSVVLNEGNFGDSQETVLFFDADNLNSGPLFSVHFGWENNGSNPEEVIALDVDPDTGDVYLLGFDSGDPNDVTTNPVTDNDGDYDIYRINFDTVFDDWTTNIKGVDVRATIANGDPNDDLITPLSPDPDTGGGYASDSSIDYVTYSILDLTFPAFPDTSFNALHTNRRILDGAIEKIGEVKRNATKFGEFDDPSLEFIDQNTLLVRDDYKRTAPEADLDPNDKSQDQVYRIFERVSTDPNMVPIGQTTPGFDDGGYNSNGSSESWISRDIGQVDLDGGSVSEAESTAYYEDPNGIRGIWVTESDNAPGSPGGDNIAFLELDPITNNVKDPNNGFSGYREHATAGGGSARFLLDNDPTVSTTSNDGKADNIFVDQDTGDLIIIESGFGDGEAADPNGFGIGLGADHEPKVIRRTINTYNNGLGQIELGGYSVFQLDPSTETPGEDPNFTELGMFTAYDSVNDLVYFWNPGAGGSETPSFGLDVWVLDLTTGLTSAFLDLDQSVSLFTDPYGDKTDFFDLTPEPNADFNGDSIVNGLDFLIWQQNFGLAGTSSTGDADNDGDVDADDLAVWESQYGTSPLVPNGGQAVPEPSTILLMGLAVALLPARRRTR